MKKTLFLAILAGAALAGCVKNEEVAMSDTSPERITFDAPVVSVPTRATEIVGNYPGDKDFAVYALYHENQYDASAFTNPVYYMSDVTCTADNTTAPTTWNPTTAYYWPKKGYLTFAAYAPSSVDATWNVNGFKFANFTVDGTPANQIDLLYSERQYDKKNIQDENNVVTDKPYDGVTIPFKHALSSIVFTAKAEVADVVTLIGIKVDNVIGTGTFNQGYPNDGSVAAENAQWEFAAAPTRTYYDVFKANNAEERITLSTDKQYFTATTTATGGTRKSDLILIPQPLNTENHKVNVSITYSINGVEVTKVFDLAVVNPTPDDGNGNILYEWKKGYRYTYDITIGLEKIYFNPTVGKWDEAAGGGIQKI